MNVIIRCKFLTKNIIMKYIKRIIALPFFLLLNIIGVIFHLFTLSKYFILYGGEAKTYDKKDVLHIDTTILYQTVWDGFLTAQYQNEQWHDQDTCDLIVKKLKKESPIEYAI